MGKNLFDKNKIDKQNEKLCKKHKVVGANVALFNSEGIVYTYNYGYINKEQNRKSTNDSLYMIASNTKVLTAMGIFKLIEDGVISLNDDIRKYIPEFEVKSLFEYEKITIENLLMHRSGLVSDLFQLAFDHSRDYHETIEELKNTYLTAVPGVMYSYSNVGYTLLGIILERVSGLSYVEYIRKVITNPLGIKIYFLKGKEEKKPYEENISLSYNKNGEPGRELSATMVPAGSITYMSINDFVKIGQVFLNKENATILRKATLERMEILNLKDELDRELTNVGYGLFHNHYDFGESVGKVLGHGGDTTCHHSMFNYIPGLNIGVVVFTNSEQATELSRELGLGTLASYLKKMGYIQNELSTTHKHVSVDCDYYLGRYATPFRLLEISKNSKNELVSKMFKFPIKLIPCEDGYLQFYPNKWKHKIPPFRKLFNRFRLKVCWYQGNEVVILEQSIQNHRSKNIIGCRYVESEIPQSFRDACGQYQVIHKNLEQLKINCALYIEGEVLKLSLGVRNLQMKNYLKVLDDNLAVIQGFGRNTREVIQIRKEADEVYLIYNGIVFEKLT